MRSCIYSYYVRIRPQLNGINSIHREDCPFLPDFNDRIYLGKFSSYHDAVRKARCYFPEVNLCKFCISETISQEVKILTGHGRSYHGYSLLELPVKN